MTNDSESTSEAGGIRVQLDVTPKAARLAALACPSSGLLGPVTWILSCPFSLVPYIL